MSRRARIAAVVEECPQEETPRRPSSTWSRRRRLLWASQWRSRDIEGIREYVRRVERAIARSDATARMRGRGR